MVTISPALPDDAASRLPTEASPDRCRSNSRRGLTDTSRTSYPPVVAACRVLDILRCVNDLRIATVNGIHERTGIPKSTVVRMLETLMAEGYVARDNMCGGYRVTHNVRDLASGYDRVSRVIEIARPFAVELTRTMNWPVGLGVPDGDAIAIQFWTGTISPWAHTNTVLGLRPDYHDSAMGRAYMSFCSDEERNYRLAQMKADPGLDLDDYDIRYFLTILEHARADGFAIRDPNSPPFNTTTIGMPVREGGVVRALVSVSVYRSAVRRSEIREKVIPYMREMIGKIEAALDAAAAGGGFETQVQAGDEEKVGF